MLSSTIFEMAATGLTLSSRSRDRHSPGAARMRADGTRVESGQLGVQPYGP